MSTRSIVMASPLLILVAVALAGAAAAPPAGGKGKSETHTLKAGGHAASIDIPTHKAVTVTGGKDGMVFYSVDAGYEPTADGPYANITGELMLALQDGTLKEVMDQMKETNVGTEREIVKEIKKGEQVIWLVRDKKAGAEKIQNNRAFQFVPAQGAVLILDVTGRTVPGMPPGPRKQANDLLMAGLKSIKLDDKPIATPEVQKYVMLK